MKSQTIYKNKTINTMKITFYKKTTKTTSVKRWSFSFEDITNFINTIRNCFL